MTGEQHTYWKPVNKTSPWIRGIRERLEMQTNKRHRFKTLQRN